MKNNEIIMKKDEIMDHGTRIEQKSSKIRRIMIMVIVTVMVRG